MPINLTIDLNSCFITARIVKQPKQILLNNTIIADTEINFPQAQAYFASMSTRSDKEIANNMVELYTIGDYILLEGETIISKFYLSKYKHLIYLTDVQPAII